MTSMQKQTYRVSGQAMVELTVALVIILVLFTGLLQAGRIVNARTETMMKARYNAALNAMAENYYPPMGAMYILSWAPGPDGKAYTADDVPFPARDAAGTALEIMSVADHDDLTGLVPGNVFSEIRQTEDIMRAFCLVHGRSTESVETFPAFRRLIYGRPTVEAESESWLVWTKGIY